VVSTNPTALQHAHGHSDASIPAIQQINPRQLMCILHLMKLGAGDPTYYQLAGVRKPLPESRWGHLGEADFTDMEEEASALRLTDRSSPFAPPSCPRPSSGGITDSFGRPFKGLWGPDDDETEEASTACDDGEAATNAAVQAPPLLAMEPEDHADDNESEWSPAPHDPPGLRHLSLRLPDQLQTEDDDDENFFEPPPPPGGQRGRRGRLRVAESVAESVRESFHFDHFADEEGDIVGGSCGDGVSEEDEEEQWSLDARTSISDRRSSTGAPGGA